MATMGECMSYHAPSAWYEQPVAARIKAMHFYIDRSKEAIAKLLDDPFPKPWRDQRVAQHERTIARLEALVMNMQEIGRPLA